MDAGFPVLQAPFHEGERALQRHAGAQERLAEVGPRVIRSYMPEQHRRFFEQLPMVVAGSLDATGQPWASLLWGPAGFMQSPDPQHLRLQAKPHADDPLARAWLPGAPAGLLGIEPHTRRRNRMNGVVQQAGDGAYVVAVSESFGNCPQYIQARQPVAVDRGAPSAAVRFTTLDPRAQALVRQADTLFIATAHPGAATQASGAGYGVDVSHRGGRPGFVRVQGNTLTVPDFLGNFFFNTLGNLALHPYCGLLFTDYETGDLLQLAARAEIIQDGPEVRAFEGAQRLLRLHVAQGQWLPVALPLAWGEVTPSPLLARTGVWAVG